MAVARWARWHAPREILKIICNLVHSGISLLKVAVAFKKIDVACDGRRLVLKPLGNLNCYLNDTVR